jgi:hypothetical protein
MFSHASHLANDQALFPAELSITSLSSTPLLLPQESISNSTQDERYHPYTFSYGASPENVEAFDRPLIFAPPLPDPNAFDEPDQDEDSTLGDEVSVRSVLVDDAGYQWRHEHGRRYHGRFGGLRDYYLPNGMT